MNTFSSLDFLAQVLRAMPFAIRKIQTDHGTEFSFAFILAIERAGIRHRYIQPRRPEQDGKVERSHRIDAEEFWGRHSFQTFEAAPRHNRGRRDTRQKLITADALAPPACAALL